MLSLPLTHLIWYHSDDPSIVLLKTYCYLLLLAVAPSQFEAELTGSSLRPP